MPSPYNGVHPPMEEDTSRRGGMLMTPAPVGAPIPIPGGALPPPPASATTPPPPSPEPRPTPLPGVPRPPKATVDPPEPLPTPLPGVPQPPKGTVPTPPAPGPTNYPVFTGAGTGSAGAGPGTSRSVGLMDYREGMAANDRNAITRGVGENELTSNQLSRLLDENGRYIQSARLRGKEQAAGSGMLLSGVAAGMSQRSAIDAGAPIAQADAGVYANTASENMRAQNDDVMADQSQGRQLFGQSMGIRAQLDDSAANRDFQSAEAFAERGWRSGEAGLDRTQQAGMQNNEFGWRSGEAGLDRGFQERMQGLTQQFQRQEGETERDWRDRVQSLDQQFTGGQNEASRYQDRFNSYTAMMAAREGQFSQQLASIYSNTALTPAQQQAAANNARAIFTSVTSSFNAAFAQGLPEIFAAPYNMASGGASSPGTTAASPVPIMGAPAPAPAPRLTGPGLPAAVAFASNYGAPGRP